MEHRASSHAMRSILEKKIVNDSGNSSCSWRLGGLALLVVVWGLVLVVGSGCAEAATEAPAEPTLVALQPSKKRGKNRAKLLKVWTTARTVKVRRDAKPASGTTVAIGAARNEWESFQILFRSPTAVKNISLEPSDLLGAKDKKIPAKRARLYRQHFIEVTESSAGRGRRAPFRPGWFADGLIPFKNPETRKPLPKARLVAVPFNLPANETHGFWIDVYVPKGTPPGKYSGTYRLTVDGDTVAEVPVNLTVWNFQLPDTLSLKTYFGTYAGALRKEYPRVTGQDEEQIDWRRFLKQTNDVIRRHGINPHLPRDLTFPKKEGGQYRFSKEQLKKLRAAIDHYGINAVCLGQPVGHRTASKMRPTPANQKKYIGHMSAYADAIHDLDRPHVVFYNYLIDEPKGPGVYRFIREWGEALQKANKDVKVMVTEQTTPENPRWGSLHGAVNIWCPAFKEFDPTAATKRRRAGDTLWIYDALHWWQIDYPLINYRAPAWMAWHYRIEGLLYWKLVHWKQVNDPWTDSVTFTNRAGLKFNGEGSLLLPGHAVGFSGTVPTIRLKAIRDSIEDYEYLTLLQKKVGVTKVRNITGQVIGVSKNERRPFLKFYTDPTLHEKTRVAIAETIAEKKVNKPRRKRKR